MRRFLRPVPLAIAAGSLLLVYALVGFFLVPYLIKAYGVPAIAEKLQRPVLVKDVEVNPFKLSLRLTGFEVRERDDAPLLGLEEFFINIRAVSLFRRAYVFDTIRLTVPFVAARVAKDGSLNLANIVPPEDAAQTTPPPTEKAPVEAPTIEIGQFEIARGVVEFRDESKPRPFTLDIVPINLVLNNFHTKPGGDNTYAFTAELGKGETLDWKGTISLEPFQSSGTFLLSGIKLPTLWQYLHNRFRFDITDGAVTADARYRLDAGANPMELHVEKANVRVDRFALREDGSLDPVITIPKFAVEGVDVDLVKQEILVEKIASERASFTSWLNPDGTSNYQQLFALVESEELQPAASEKPPPAKNEKPWSITLKDIALKDYAADFEDRTLSTPARMEARALTLKTHDVKIPITAALPLEMGMQLNGIGTIQVAGSLLPQPFQAVLTIAIKDVAIRPFQPYLQKFARIDLQSGAFNLDGALHLATVHPKKPLLSFEGSSSLTGVHVADRDQGQEVASLKALSLDTLRVTVDPTTVSIEEIGLQQPVVHVVVLSDGSMNLSKLAAAPGPTGTEPPSAEPQKAKRAPVPITIGTVKLAKAVATFRDESVQPPVQTGLFDLSGTIKGLSSKQVARADVDLTGRMDKAAPLKISGTINPLSEDAFSDVTVTLGGMDLTPEGPYSGKYVGYGLSKGKFSLDLKYKISQQQLEAENKVLVDQLTFGEKTNSPDATSLPVPLAVALLKDRKGRIEIDLPIRGDLKDPDFKYGKVVLSTLLNLLTKIVASPFTLMGKLIPGESEEELQFVEFSPGIAVIPEDEIKKLDALAKALDDRPGLRLDVAGAADPERDRRAIGERKLREQLLAVLQKERGSSASKPTGLTIEDEQRLVADLYEKNKAQVEKPGTVQPKGEPSKPPTVAEMKQRLAAAIPVDENELRDLARRRAEQVREHLVMIGKLTDERVFLLEVNLTATGHEKVRSQLAMGAGS